jgi:hypothetical protein
MTCEHVLGLIDAGPFADYPATHLDAAWKHARGCPSCGPALAAAAALDSSLAALPHPRPPADLTQQVMARIERTSSAATDEHIVPAGAGRAFHWAQWASLLGGLMAGLSMILASQAHGFAEGIASVSFARTTAGLSAMPSSGGEAVALVAGLILYVAGLFAPIRADPATPCNKR